MSHVIIFYFQRNVLLSNSCKGELMMNYSMRAREAAAIKITLNHFLAMERLAQAMIHIVRSGQMI